MSDLNPAVAEQHAHDGVGGRVRDGEVQRRPALVVGPVDHAGVGVQQELDAPKGEWWNVIITDYLCCVYMEIWSQFIDQWFIIDQ